MSSTNGAGMIAASLIAEIEEEEKAARACLERIPADKFDWKPHEKSMPFGRLAVHVAEMFGWVDHTLTTDELDFAANPETAFEPKSTEELVAYLDEQLTKAKSRLAQTPDEAFMPNWTLRAGDQVFFTLPKIVVLRTVVLNHIYHHRGQLSVYMRLNDILVPSIYGPSADAPM